MWNSMRPVLLLVLTVFFIGCQGNVSGTDDPSTCVPECSGKECGADGCGGTCGACPPNFGCSESFVCEASTCGNGVLEDYETCDPGFPEGHENSCPTECPDDGDACTIDDFFGSPETCDARCPRTPIIKCESGDGCCPDGCLAVADADCVDFCEVNGTLDDGEACDPDIADTSDPGYCPTQAADCDDGDACTTNGIVGQPENCSADCNFDPVEACEDGDGCCPEGCDMDEDSDCQPECGDGVVTEPEETCDTAIADVSAGGCPVDGTDCDDNVACTSDEVMGDPTMCLSTCTNTEITACTSDDGCCPTGCTEAMDNDCTAVCGDGNVEPPETCDNAIPDGTDGACPVAADCDDMDACTTDVLAGDAAQCTAECQYDPITTCTNADGCCVPTCTPAMDDDCDPVCTDYCNKALANCTGANELYADLATCTTACEGLIVGDDMAATSGDTIYCRINHLDLAAADPDTHCSHAEVVSPVCN